MHFHLRFDLSTADRLRTMGLDQSNDDKASK